MLLRVGDEYYEYQIKKDVYLLVSINKLFCRELFITRDINDFSINNIKLDIIITNIRAIFNSFLRPFSFKILFIYTKYENNKEKIYRDVNKISVTILISN